MSGDFTRLVSEHLDDPRPESAAAIEREAASEPQLRSQYVELVRLHRILSSELRSISLVERFREELRPSSLRRGHGAGARKPLRLWGPWLAAAGLVIVLSGAAILAMPWGGGREECVSLGGIARMEGGVGVDMPPGSRFRSGCELRASDPNRTCGFSFADGTRIVMNYGTQVAVGADAPGKRMTLEHGEISADVAKQPAGSPFVVSSRYMIATVVGTRFTMRSSEGSFLSVQEGVVSVSDAARSKTVSVHAGSWAAVKSDQRIEYSGPTVWDLDAVADRIRILGKIGRDHAGGSISLASVAHVPSDPIFRPDQIICLQPPLSSPTLFGISAGFTIHFRIRAGRSGYAVVTLESPKSAGGKTENHCSRHIAIDGDWRDVTIQAADFPVRNVARPIQDGLQVQTMCVWGFDSGTIEIADLSLSR